METLTEEDVMPIGNRLLKVLSRRICLISRSPNMRH